MESIFLSWYGKILLGIPATKKKKKSVSYAYVFEELDLVERQGKARITTVRSPRSTLHNPITADHTHAAEIKSVLSLPAPVLAFLPLQHLSCQHSCLRPAPGQQPFPAPG